MDAKLILKLDKDVISKAKDYARTHNESLSRMVESYLKTLVQIEEGKRIDGIQISPFIEELSSGLNIPHDLDYKELYRKHLLVKHK